MKFIPNKEILKNTDYELNILTYEIALIHDKRSFTQYYLSFLKSKDLLFFLFYNNNDYNSNIIKKFLFIFFFNLNLSINGLFFNDKTIHKIYIEEGSYNIVYQIPHIIYTSLISYILSAVIKFIASSEKNINELKKVESIESLNQKYEGLLQAIKNKYLLFFIITFIILLAFEYYNICFCGIYVNTQIHLIKRFYYKFHFNIIISFHNLFNT